MKFCIDTERAEQISMLKAEEKAELLDAMFNYWREQEVVITSTLCSMLWKTIVQSFDRDALTKREISMKRAEAGKKGGIKKRENLANVAIATKENVKEQPKQNEEQIQYAEFVFMTESEHKKLERDFGGKLVREYIEALNNWIGEKPNLKERKNRKAYYTIRNRLNRDAKKNPQGETAKARENRLIRERDSQKLQEQLTRESGKDWRSQVGLF